MWYVSRPGRVLSKSRRLPSAVRLRSRWVPDAPSLRDLPAAAVEPGEAAHVRLRDEGDRPGARREACGTRGVEVPYALGDRHRVAGNARALPVETLRDERPFARIHEKSGLEILKEGRDAPDGARGLAGLDQHQVPLAVELAGDVEEPLAIGKKPGPRQSQLDVLGVGLDDDGGLPAGSGDAVERGALDAR